MNGAQVVGVIADVFTWTTIPLAVLCYLIAAGIRAWRREGRDARDSHEVATLRLVGGVLLGVGLLSIVVSVVLTFVGG